MIGKCRGRVSDGPGRKVFTMDLHPVEVEDRAIREPGIEANASVGGISIKVELLPVIAGVGTCRSFRVDRRARVGCVETVAVLEIGSDRLEFSTGQLLIVDEKFGDITIKALEGFVV